MAPSPPSGRVHGKLTEIERLLHRWHWLIIDNRQTNHQKGQRHNPRRIAVAE